MGLRGPAPQSRATLEARGSWRAKGRVDPPGAQGRPACPRSLSGDARAFWKAVVPGLVACGVAGRLAPFARRGAAEMWGRYRAVLAKAQAAPADKPARCAVAAYQSAWAGLAAKLGLTPADRARLQAAGLWSEPLTEDDD